jgi:hypothetical protein
VPGVVIGIPLRELSKALPMRRPRSLRGVAAGWPKLAVRWCTGRFVRLHAPSQHHRCDPPLVIVKALPEILPPVRCAADKPHCREQEVRLLFGCWQGRQELRRWSVTCDAESQLLVERALPPGLLLSEDRISSGQPVCRIDIHRGRRHTTITDHHAANR